MVKIVHHFFYFVTFAVSITNPSEMTPSQTPSAEKRTPLRMIHVGRKVPKGFRELSGSIHLGRGIWMFNTEMITPPLK